MAIALDGFATLRQIGDNRQVFSAARVEVDKAARAIIVKCLKAKTFDLAGLRAIYAALGDESFALVAHDLKATESSALLKRLDKHFPDANSASLAERAGHLIALANCGADPSSPPPTIKKKPPKRAPKRVRSELMQAFAKGGRDDD